MKNKKKNLAVKGIAWAALASISWALSGTVLQFASQNEALPAGWFLSMRTLVCGVLLLAVSAFLYGKKIFRVFKNTRSTLYLIGYGVIGLALNLFSFYLCIQSGNAGAATILQYLAPIFIVLGALVFQHRLPSWMDLMVFGIALIGVVLAITKGNLTELAIPGWSLFFGIISGLTAACYVVFPRPLTDDPENSPLTILGWGTIIAALVFNIPYWGMHLYSAATGTRTAAWLAIPNLHLSGVLCLLSAVFLGTIFPFLMILHAGRFTPSEDISLTDAIQPAATIVFTYILTVFGVFKTTFNWVEILGVILVIFAIYLLQRNRRKQGLEL